jgi:hypothetical protein
MAMPTAPWIGSRPAVACAALVLLASVACRSEFEGGGALRAQKVVLRREIEGARAVVARLERGEPLLPPDDVAISIDQALVRTLINAQLPFELDFDRFHLVLKDADVLFQGSPAVRINGRLLLRENPDLSAAVEVLGALEDIRVDSVSSTLRAAIAVDHLGITEATGIGQILSGAALDEVARLVRLEIADRLPTVQIPVKVQPTIDFPAVDEGPIRIDGASLPLQVAVSQVTAGQGRLWIAVHVQPGEFVKTTGTGKGVGK